MAGLIGLTPPMLVFDYRLRMMLETTEDASNGRANTILAAAVDQAVAMMERSGARSAALFLEAQGVGFGLICRVLAQPDRRRRGDAP